jgi:hypothetical protein
MLGALLATGCGDKGDDFSPIVVDIAANCAEAELEILLAEMEEGNRPWDRVLAVAVDAPGVDRYWALVEYTDPNIGPGLGLTHIDGTDWTIPLPIQPADLVPGASLTLRPGPIPGTAWLVHKDVGTFRLWSVDATNVGFDPFITRSQDHGLFPESAAYLCEEGFGELGPCDVSEWERELVFLDGYAFVAAIPPFSPNNTTYVYLGPLDTYLGINESKELTFERQCDPTEPLAEYTACTEENAATTYPVLTLMGSQQSTNAAEHRMFLLRQRAIGGIPEPAREVVFLKLLLDDRKQPAGTIQSKALADVVPIGGPPSGIARDEFASYMLHPTKAPDGVGPPAITRLAELEDEFDVLQGIPLRDDVSLLQLESDIALGRVVDGTWEITKLFPDAPERSEVAVYTGSAEITGVAPAGHGAFLVFKAARGPDLVQLGCPEDSPP